MTKGRAQVPWKVVAGSKAFFITLAWVADPKPLWPRSAVSSFRPHADFSEIFYLVALQEYWAVEVGLADELFAVEGGQLAVNVCSPWPGCSY